MNFTKFEKELNEKNGFKMMRLLGKLIKIAAAFLLVSAIAMGIAYYVVFNVGIDKDPERKFDRDSILENLSGETRVFYRDGERRLGAFFDANHRIYVPYGDIPENIVNALVAAEDAHFFEHNGFDMKGFLRAMVTNLRAGSFKQGGSTLTQQTVKNIFGREERSIKEKFNELRNAIKLERHFTKEQILEFYLNQFHVSGSGKGVAIAAQYFFNKELKDLTLAECAFIAGSVKGPFNYDPFAQRTTARKEKALERGRTRVQYVLKRMEEDGYISKEEREAALAKPLVFEHGTFRYSVSTQLALVEEKLNSDFYGKIFEKEGIEDWRRAQLEIITTVDANYQEAAKQALQANISNLQLKLGGFTLPSATRSNTALRADKGDYLYGSLDSATWDQKGKLKNLYLSFGQIHGVVEQKTLQKLESEIKADLSKTLASKLAPGSVLLVSVLDSVTIDGLYRCKLETEPVLQGAIVALQNGEVVASQAGFHNTGFDRSFKALRQLGSAWKPLLFALSFTYGWNYLDELENDFNVFQYGNQFYFPRPDHKKKGNTVSIAWASTKSENIASVWLLEHLFDKLSIEEFADVVQKNGYAQNTNADSMESDKAYFERLRDKYGLTMRESVKQEIEFEKARHQYISQLYAKNRFATARAVQNLLYGSKMDVAQKAAKTAENRKMLLHNFLRYENILRERRLAEANASVENPLPPADSVELYPDFTLADFTQLSLLVEPVQQEANYLDIENLKYWPDFKRSLAMADFARFAKEIGIHSDLQKVQSMVLGVNDISLAEITTAYETVLSGKIFKCKDSEWSEPCLIREIKNRDGKVIFKNEVEAKQILSDTVTSQMAVILRSVFVNGTAFAQLKNINVVSDDGRQLKFPAMGKTGTTNDFRNVAFVGGIPTYSTEQNGFTTDSVMAIGSYVGFDNNKPLKSGRTRIAGSSGGLPQWVSFVNNVIKIRNDAAHTDFYSIQNIKEGEAPLVYKNWRGSVQVHPLSGLALSDAENTEEKMRSLPWLEVPGFVPPQMQSVAAEAAAKEGFITIAPAMPNSFSDSADNLLNTNTNPDSSDNIQASTPSDDWELPADFDGKNTFVPLEMEF